MLIREHLLKADRLAGSGSRLEVSGGGLLAVWAYMHSATHALNAALHAQGITAERVECSTNSAGEYVTPHGDPLPAGEFGDLIHTDMPPIEYPNNVSWSRAVAAITEIERLCGPAMRMPGEPTSEDVARCRRRLLEMRGVLAGLVMGAEPDG